MSELTYEDIEDRNECYVFRIPARVIYTSILSKASNPIGFEKVDQFNIWPDPYCTHYDGPMTWEQVKLETTEYIKAQSYAEKGCKYLVITDFDKAFIVDNT